jgi:hypothetical protein
VEILGAFLKFPEVPKSKRMRTGVRVKRDLTVLVSGREVWAFRSRHCPEPAADSGFTERSGSPIARIPVGGAD